MSLPEVSVVIPVRNGSKYIEECIDSVYNQTFQNFEIIVVDDGSTDDTVSKLCKYDDKLRLIKQKPMGTASALNKAIKSSRGNYFCFIASDDLWVPDKLQEEFSCMMSCDDVGVVYSDFYMLIEGNVPIRRHLPPAHILKNLISKGTLFFLSSSMIRMDVLNDLKSISGNYFDVNDKLTVEWLPQLTLSQICNFKHLPLPLSYYRTHRKQASKSLNAIRDSWSVYKKLNKNFTAIDYARHYFIPLSTMLIRVLLENILPTYLMKFIFSISDCEIALCEMD